MRRADFAASTTGTLVPTDRDQWAFVPHDLPPPRLNLSALARPLSRAAQALGELNGIGRILGDPYLLVRPLQTREALTSSSMEGTYTTIDDLLLADAGAREHDRMSDAREVLNYRRALSAAIDSLEELPLCLRTLRDAHRTLLTGLRPGRGHGVRPGEFKQHQNFIGAYEIENARYVPPPPGESLSCLDALERYIHRETPDDIPPLVDLALVHYQFEAIHPFADGNGRVGRMLILLHMYTMKLTRQPILYLSPVLEARKDEYIDRMYAVSQAGDWEAWVNFFLEVVHQASTEAIDTAEALLALQTDYRKRLQKAGRSANLLAIVDALFKTPVVTIPQLASQLKVTYRAAQLNVETMMRAGILSEFKDSSNPRYFGAREIMNIVTGIR